MSPAGLRHLGQRRAYGGPRVRRHQVVVPEGKVSADDRGNARLGQDEEVLRHQPERRDHDPREPLLDGLPQERAFLLPVGLRVADHDVQAENTQFLLQGGCQLSEEGIGEIRHDQCHDARTPGAQTSRHRVHAEAQIGDRLLDHAPGVLGDRPLPEMT